MTWKQNFKKNLKTKKNYSIFKVIKLYSKLDSILDFIKHEFNTATKKFGTFNNAHEGYAVLLEEVDELWEAIKLKQSNPKRLNLIQKEAIQVSAMAIRIIYDCI